MSIRICIFVVGAAIMLIRLIRNNFQAYVSGNSSFHIRLLKRSEFKQSVTFICQLLFERSKYLTRSAFFYFLNFTKRKNFLNREGVVFGDFVKHYARAGKTRCVTGA